MTPARKTTPKATNYETIDAMVERAIRTKIPLRRTFVQQKDNKNKSIPGPLAGFVSSNDRFGLLQYLLLMTCASGNDFDVSHHSLVWARALGLNDPPGPTERTRVSKGWHRLEARGLVKRERKKRTAMVTPLCEDGHGEPYTRPSAAFINVPHALWTKGPGTNRWYEVLTLPELATLLIALMNLDEFALPSARVPEFYGISADTFERGVHALERHKLLTIEQTSKKAPLAPLGFTFENRYTLREPFGPVGKKTGKTGSKA